MTINYSLKHAKGECGPASKVKNAKNGFWLKNAVPGGLSLVIRIWKVAWHKTVSYKSGHVLVDWPLDYYKSDYSQLPAGTVVVFTQDSLS